MNKWYFQKPIITNRWTNENDSLIQSFVESKGNLPLLQSSNETGGMMAYSWKYNGAIQVYGVILPLSFEGPHNIDGMFLTV